MIDTVDVFVGRFADRFEATSYTEPRWEDEPDETASDDEYDAWEERNPIWPLRAELGGRLDPDFIETIDEPARYEYLAGLLVDPTAIEEIRRTAANANVLVLVFEESKDPRTSTPCVSTSRLTYCGRFACRL